MKLSVSLPEDDVEFLDEYASQTGVGSRSAIVHQAIDLLRSASLEDDYVAAWEEWEGTEDARLWDSVSGDGIDDAPR